MERGCSLILALATYTVKVTHRTPG